MSVLILIFKNNCVHIDAIAINYKGINLLKVSQSYHVSLGFIHTFCILVYCLICACILHFTSLNHILLMSCFFCCIHSLVSFKTVFCWTGTCCVESNWIKTLDRRFVFSNFGEPTDIRLTTRLHDYNIFGHFHSFLFLASFSCPVLQLVLLPVAPGLSLFITPISNPYTRRNPLGNCGLQTGLCSKPYIWP